MDTGKGWSTVVVHVIVALIDEHSLVNTRTGVLVEVGAEVLRHVADYAPEDRKAIGIGVVENVV